MFRVSRLACQRPGKSQIASSLAHGHGRRALVWCVGIPSLQDQQRRIFHGGSAPLSFLRSAFHDRYFLRKKIAFKTSKPSCQISTSSDQGVLRADVWLDPLPNRDFVSFLFERFQQWPDNTAILCDETGRSYSYGALMEGSLRWGSALKGLSKDGSVPASVAIMSHNVPEYPLVIFGAQGAGCSVTTISVVATPTEIARQLDDSDASVVVVDASLEAQAREALTRTTSGRDVILVTIGKSAHGFPDLLDIINDNSLATVDRVENHPDKMALILYSSGTTGTPKGVCSSHRVLSNYLPILTHPSCYPPSLATPGKQVTSIGLMPFYHGFGLLAVAMGCFYLGHRLVCAPQPSPARFAELTKKYRPLILHLVPPLLNFLTQSPLVSAEHLASVSNVIVTGAPVHPAVAKAFTEKASQKITFQEALGMTEILCLTLTPLLQQKLGSCGKLFPNMEARVEDLETREPLGPQRPGELVVRGPPLFSHYHKNPEATAAVFTPDGWFRTGDVVCYDEDGFFSVVDRFKELIKVKAFQVSPSELEDLILQVEEVLDVGVVGVPDDRSGELPRAFVVLKENVTDPQILGQISNKINSHMKENAAPYKQLAAGIFYVETLPKNRTGKLLRRELRDMAVKTS